MATVESGNFTFTQTAIEGTLVKLKAAAEADAAG